MNIELFPCSGGMSEGLRRAGISIDLAFDFDADACDSYERNLGHRPVQMDVRDLLRMVRSGWSPGPVTFFCADPPCTPWSNAGKKQGLKDDRDMLITTMVLIELLLPQCWMVANVPGLDNSDNWGSVVQPVIGGMAQRSGYCVDYASLDAADYGVPQRRRRPFWFGHPRGTPCIDWPHPTHCAPPVLPGCGLKPHVTCREALGHLPIEQLGRLARLRKRGCESKDPARCGTKPRASCADMPAGVVTTRENGDGNALVVNAKHRPQEMDEPAMVVRTGGERDHSPPQIVMRIDPKHPINDADSPANAVLSSDGGGSKRAIKWRRNHELDKPGRTVTAAHEGGNGRCLDWPWDRPSTTVSSDERLDSPGHHDPSIPNSQHGEQAIVLSEKAGAVLQGFSESWVFCGKTKRARWGQIGMATPPPLAEAVGRSIASWLARSVPR